MNINLADELKNLKVTLQLSVDSVTVGNAVSEPPARMTVTDIGLKLCTQANGSFLLKMNAAGYWIWAKSFAVTDVSQVIAKSNPFENDNGAPLITGALAPGDTTVPAVSMGYTRVVRVWALPVDGYQFEALQAQGVACPSSSSSSSISSVSSRSSLSSGNSSGSTSSRSSVNSSGSTVSMSSLNSTSSSPSTPSSPSSPSTPSGTSGTSPFPRPARK